MQSEPPPRITYAVARVERLMRLHLDEIVRRHDLTVPQYTTMSVLARRSGLSGAQLARRAFVTPQAISVIIRDLSLAGLVVRDSSEVPGRSVTTSLTREGRRRLRDCDRAVDDLEERLYVAGGRAGVSQFRAVLETWTEQLAADL